MNDFRNIPFSITEADWDEAPLHPHTEKRCAHIWRVPLNGDEVDLSSMHALLDPVERGRARRLVSHEKRRRFALAHGRMREILGRYLELRPEQVMFCHEAGGKPHLKTADGNRVGIHFNLSHSGEMALLAVSPFEIGVDVERIRNDKDVLRLGRLTMNRSDLDTLRGAEPTDRAPFFYAHWILREAFAKARGEGMTSLLGDHSTLCQHGSFVLTGDNSSTPDAWFAQLLIPAPGYIGCVAAQGCDWELRCYEITGRRHIGAEA